jgi:hypothetical protein
VMGYDHHSLSGVENLQIFEFLQLISKGKRLDEIICTNSGYSKLCNGC